jgi:hypothetical protein
MKNRKSADLLNDKFGYLVNHVLESVQRDTVPFLYDKKEIYLGKHLIRKEDQAYVIYNGKELVNEECYFLLESAMLVSLSLQKNNYTLFQRVVDLDKKFTKYYFDCVHIHKAIKELRKGDDEDNFRANALVDKYFYAREKRNYIKKSIRSVCLRNIKKR